MARDSDERKIYKIQEDPEDEGYQMAKGMLNEDEPLRMFSKRKPQLITGIVCICMGLLFAWQVIAYYVLAEPQWAVPVLILSVAMVWVGVWLAMFAKKEFIFMTDNRIVHQKVNIYGKYTKEPVSIPFSEITGTSLYRRAATLKASSRRAGDILIKKNRRSYLMPTTKDGYLMAELLVEELQIYHSEDAEE